MKRLIYFIAILVGMYLIISLSKSLIDAWRRERRIEEAQETLSSEKKKFDELTLKKKEVESQEFIEKQAREKLLLGKPGESQVIIDQLLLEALEGTKSAETLDNRPNWQKWWDLFFK